MADEQPRDFTPRMSVYLDELEVYGYVGVSPEERTVGHRLNINVHANLRAENLGQDVFAVSYADLAEIASDVVAQTKCETLEYLVFLIAKAVLVRCESIDFVYVDVAKIAPPFPQIAKSASVRLGLARTHLVGLP